MDNKTKKRLENSGMSKKQIELLATFPTFDEDLKEHLKNDPEYADMWLNDTIAQYSETKDLNDLIYSLKPLIEANYTICDFAKKVGVHRVTLYKIFSRKIVPSIEVLNKIFGGLGYHLHLTAQRI
jgi:DNA-binding phage protein